MCIMFRRKKQTVGPDSRFPKTGTVSVWTVNSDFHLNQTAEY